MLQNYLSTGDPLFFTHNPHWTETMHNPLMVIVNGMNNSYFTFKFLSLYSIAVIVFWLYFFKAIPLSLHIINLYSLLIPLSFLLASMPRMSLVAFPLFIQLNYAAEKLNARTFIIVILAMFQGFLAVCWFLGFGNVV